MTIKRTQAGVPTGGQFKAGVHGDPGTDVLVADRQACSQCGTSTKRSSGLCRRCDPHSKANKQPSSRRSPVPGVEQVTTSGPVYDRDADPLTVEEIGQCSFEFVPVFRNGARSETETRPCKNAVRLPAERCHQHGGATATSLGRSVAKATAEAGRGECFPLADEHWDQVDERLSVAEGQLLRMLETDTSALAQMLVDFRRQQSQSGVSRFSPMNQMLVIVQHCHADPESGSFDGAVDKAIEKASEPHMTAKKWAEHGRTPEGDGVAVVWWQPGRPGAKREEGESDDDYKERLQSEGGRGWRGRHGALIQYPLSATTGDPYEVAEAPLATARPTGYGDPEEALATMTGVASDMGISVAFVDKKPSSGYAYWRADTSEIVVWTGVGGGDRRAVAHALAHELGHARLGHSTGAQAEHHTPEKEMAAESFAALTCAHHGIDSSQISAHYVEDWRSAQGIKSGAGGLAPLRSAAAAFDEYVTASA